MVLVAYAGPVRPLLAWLLCLAAFCRVLRKRCLHLVVADEVKRRSAVLREEGRQHVRWVCFSSRRACACMCVTRGCVTPSKV